VPVAVCLKYYEEVRQADVPHCETSRSLVPSSNFTHANREL